MFTQFHLRQTERNRSSRKSIPTVEPLERRLLLTTLLYELQELQAPDRAAGDDFGRSVAIDGNVAVVGAPGDDERGRDAGAAVVYFRDDQGTTDVSDDRWELVTVLRSNDSESRDEFGMSVAIEDHGNGGYTLAVGAPAGDGNANDSGAVYVFQSMDGLTWSEEAVLSSIDASKGDKFGGLRGLSISGDTIVVGARDRGAGSQTGAAYVFGRSGGLWTQRDVLLPSSPEVQFGFSVSVSQSGDTVAVGTRSTGAYVYTWSGTDWEEQTKLTRSDGGALGFSVAASQETVVVGDVWTAWVFERGTQWDTTGQTELQELNHFNCIECTPRFGMHLAISENTVVVGAGDDGDSGLVGGGYVFQRTGSVAQPWQPHSKLEPLDGSRSVNAGVALDGGTVLLGDWADDNSGAALVYSLDASPAPPSLSIGDVSMLEGDSGNVIFEFTVTRSGDPSVPVSVDFATADGTATSPVDFTAVTTGTLTFAANEMARTITVNVHGDEDAETDENFTVNLSNATGATIADSVGLGVILDDDNLAPTMHVGDLDASTSLGHRGKWNASVFITVHDGDEQTLPGATVSGSWSMGATGSVSCTTDSNGQCVVTKNNINKNSTTVAFTIDTVSHPQNSFAPGASHDPDSDSDGTSIIIGKPLLGSSGMGSLKESGTHSIESSQSSSLASGDAATYSTPEASRATSPDRKGIDAVMDELASSGVNKWEPLAAVLGDPLSDTLMTDFSE